ncbi:MAG: GlmU family protein [Bacteroidota bacterium]
MNFILYDHSEWQQLLPLTYTRSVADIRVGILTIREKWENYLGHPVRIYCNGYLSGKYGYAGKGDWVIINSSVLPDAEIAAQLNTFENGMSISGNSSWVASCFSGDINDFIPSSDGTSHMAVGMKKISRPWDIFRMNGEEMKKDFELLTKGKISQKISDSNKIVGTHPVFLEEGAKCEASVINTTDGPVYIGKNAEIMEGSLIRGPLALCEGAQLKMGTKIYGPTTIGPHCKVGGEVNNSVIFGYSNKAHDGFLGNSVIGEWCNLGADTNNSNLKNNYGNVEMWNDAEGDYIPTGLQFCGLIMGDHSKCGINTMFNTGTTAGVNANIFGGGFPKKNIPSFAWGGPEGLTEYDLDKAIETAGRVMARRNMTLSDGDKEIFRQIFNITKKFRK